MRRYFYLITANERNGDRVGGVSINTNRRQRSEKNTEVATDKRDLETNDVWEERYVSLGYHDFEDEEDYEENVGDVIQEKLEDIDDRHLETAGLDPKGVLA